MKEQVEVCRVDEQLNLQLSISREQVWVSRGKQLRSILHMEVTVTLEKQQVEGE